MNVIQIDENGNAYGYPVLVENFRMLFPTVSFPNPLTPDAIEKFGFGCYESAAAPQCQSTEKAVEVTPQKGEDGIYRQTYEIVPLTETELAARTEAQWVYVRNRRTYELAGSDWTQVSDNQLSDEKKAQWALYRQALRDITEQVDPFDIVWPTPPQ